jgi:hypothetical protein
MALPIEVVSESMSRRPIKGFYSIFVVSFVVFFVIALVAQVLFLDWRNLLPGAEGARTMLGGVKSAVYTLMSQLT